MKNITLSVDINAPREKVWSCIIEEEKYKAWASAFYEGSTFEGGWNKGDVIRFIAHNEKGEKEGMVSEIAENRHLEHISIRHLGFMQNGVEDTTSDAIKAWAPSYENYTLEAVSPDVTRFSLDMQSLDEYYEMFMTLWPKALAKLKEVAERPL